MFRFSCWGKLGSYHWQVPVSVSSSANPKEAIASTLLDLKSCTLTLNGVKPDQWIKVSLIVIVREFLLIMKHLS